MYCNKKKVQKEFETIDLTILYSKGLGMSASFDLYGLKTKMFLRAEDTSSV